MNETIRIIGGQYRGKKLSFKAHDGLRPTPDRVRETLFNWLMHDIRDASCLDAFAGSGALGFEAFSRGAAHVTLIEQAQPTFLTLQQQAALFNSGRREALQKLAVIQTDAVNYLKTTTQSFDIIFFDPPFSKPQLYTTIDWLGEAPCLKPGGLLYVESREEITLALDHWETLKLKQAGHVIYGLYKKRTQELMPSPI